MPAGYLFGGGLKNSRMGLHSPSTCCILPVSTLWQYTVRTEHFQPIFSAAFTVIYDNEEKVRAF